MPLRKKGSLFHRGGRSHHHPPPAVAAPSRAGAPPAPAPAPVPAGAASTATHSSSSSSSKHARTKPSPVPKEEITDVQEKPSPSPKVAPTKTSAAASDRRGSKKPLETHFLKPSPSPTFSKSPHQQQQKHPSPLMLGHTNHGHATSAAPSDEGKMEHMELLPPSVMQHQHQQQPHRYQQQHYLYNDPQPYYPESDPYAHAHTNLSTYSIHPQMAQQEPLPMPPQQQQHHSHPSYYTAATSSGMVMPLPTVNVASDELLFYHHHYQEQQQQQQHITTPPTHETTILHLEKISHSIHLLHQAILAEYEELSHANNNLHHQYEFQQQYRSNRKHSNAKPVSWMPSYDPAKIFLKLQSVSLFYQDRFNKLQKQRKDYLKNKRMQQQQQQSSQQQQTEHRASFEQQEEDEMPLKTDESRDTDRLHKHSDSDQHEFETEHDDESDDERSEEWEMEEQCTWEICEESIWTCAALATACVGPAWRYQMKERKRQQTLLQRQQQQHPHSPQPGQRQKLSSSMTEENSSPSVESNPQSASAGGVGGGGMAQHQQHPPRQRQHQRPTAQAPTTTSRRQSLDDFSQATSAAVVFLVNQDDGRSSPSSASSVSSSSVHSAHHHSRLNANYPPPPPLTLSSATPPISSSPATYNNAPSHVYSSTPPSTHPSLYFQNSNNKPHDMQNHLRMQRDHPFIPEVLPVSMLRFAALVSENAIPPIRKVEWTVPIECIITATNVASITLENHVSAAKEADEISDQKIIPDPQAVSLLVREEQKWLIRRQRIGDAQRELVLALCCSPDEGPYEGGDGIDCNNEERTSAAAEKNGGKEWTILGGRVPVASMLLSWLETSTSGWVSEKSPTESVTVGLDDASSIDSSPSEDSEAADAPHDDDDDDRANNDDVNVADDSTQSVQNPAEGDNIKYAASKVITSSTPAQTARIREEIDLPWGDIVHVGALDWWHTLQVTRAAADLVSQGWCPPPSAHDVRSESAVGDNIVYGLLTIAQKGVLLSSEDTKCTIEDTDQDSREERLAASSSAAEASSALSGLGSKGFIFPTSLNLVAGVLCRLLAASDTTMSATAVSELFPLANDPIDDAEDEEWRLEKEAFLSQRELCLADAAETLWSLLANEASADTTIDFMLRMMDVNLSSSTDAFQYQMPQHQLKKSGTEEGLISIIRRRSSLLLSDIGQEEKEPYSDNTVLCACGIIRAIGAALWGNPPEVKGVPTLRIYWSTFLAMSGKVAASIHDNLENKKQHCSFSEFSTTVPSSSKDDNTVGASSLETDDRKFVLKGMTKANLERIHDDNRSTFSTSSITTETVSILKTKAASLRSQEIVPPPPSVELQPIEAYKTSSLVVVLEIAVAIRRLVDGEIVVGGGLLSPNEWDALIAAMENGLVPWLDYNYTPAGKEDDDGYNKAGQNPVSRERFSRNEFIYWRINAEVRAIFSQIETFLNHCAGHTSSSRHLIVDDKCRRSLHLLLLRRASPLLSPINAKSLAISTIRSWMAVGYLPLPGGEWIKTASRLMCETFAVYDDPSYGYLGGGYVHSPAVRLEVLYTLTCEPCENDGSPGTSSKMSPLSLTRNVRGLHLDFINSLLLPYLQATLFPEKIANEATMKRIVIFPVPPFSRAETFSTAESLDDEIKLRRNIIRILGKLFRSVTGERQQRISLIETLKLIAVNGSNLMKAVMTREKDSTKKAYFTKETILKACYELSLEAIQQLELCLRAPFDDLPHTHESVPMIVDALCAVMEAHGGQRPKEMDTMNCRTTDSMASSLLTIACIIPLARIRMTVDGRVIFLGRSAIIKIIPSSVLTVIKYPDQGDNYEHDQIDDSCFEEDKNEASLIAPFIFVYGGKQIHSQSHSSSREPLSPLRLQQFNEETVFNWDSIISTMRSVLYAQLQQDNEELPDSFTSQFDSSEMSSHIRTIIYSIIHDFINCGIPVRPEMHSPKFFPDADMVPKMTEENESIARIRALASYSSIFVGYLQKMNQSGGAEYKICSKLQEEPVYIELIEACNSPVELEAMHGCRGISVLMSLLCSPSLVDEFDDILHLKESEEATRDSWPLGWSEPIICRLKYIMANDGTACKQGDCTQVEHKILQQKREAAASDGSIDALVPLLSVLYDMFTLCKKAATCVPRKIRIQTILACHRISSSVQDSHISWQGRVLALQCAAAAIGFMAKDEVVFAMNAIGENNQGSINMQTDPNTEGAKTVETPREEGLRFSGLIFDLLRRKHLLCSSDVSRYRQETPPHLKIAKETEDIESFSACKDNSNNSAGVAVWICTDTIIMCRLGGAGTRHQGWVEITLRSPSCRVRHLLRISNRNSVKDPDFPSQLWENPKAPQKLVNDEDSLSQQKTRQMVHSSGNSVVVENAISSLRRFNEQLGSENRFLREQNGNNNADSSATGQRHAATPRMNTIGMRTGFDNGTSARSRLGRSITEKKPTQSTFWGSNTEQPPEIQESKGLRRSHSAGDVSMENSEQSARPAPHAYDSWPELAQEKSVHKWLNLVLSDSPDSFDNALEYLRALGISDQLIGLPDISHNDRNNSAFFKGVMHPLEVGPRLLRAISILDRTPTFQTHKVALLYASRCDMKEERTLANNKTESSKSNVLESVNGSPGFTKFANRLGTIVATRHLKYFSGGLDTSPYSADGEFALIWIGNEDAEGSKCDSISNKSMVLFHAVNLMPIGINNRKRHVGNDVVHIVYVDNDFLPSSERKDGKFDSNDGATISGDFGFVTIFVMPLVHVDDARVSLRIRKGLGAKITSALLHLEGDTIAPMKAVGTYVRQLAIRADLACRSMMEDRLGLVLNWEERLLQIRAMERYLEKKK